MWTSAPCGLDETVTQVQAVRHMLVRYVWSAANISDARQDVHVLT